MHDATNLEIYVAHAADSIYLHRERTQSQLPPGNSPDNELIIGDRHRILRGARGHVKVGDAAQFRD